jgi:hypothetical protein
MLMRLKRILTAISAFLMFGLISLANKGISTMLFSILWDILFREMKCWNKELLPDGAISSL